ncbi:MAG TPA: hypothetical protein VFA32_01895 [Dehalococcoidia bacterium]|nr:hypothetical protein [Dehalococcoidia bacterium]
MTLPEDTTSLNWEALLALVAQLQHQVSQLQYRVAQLADSNEALQAENAVLKRGAKRQAAPFSKGTRVSVIPNAPDASPGRAPFPSGKPPSLRRSPSPQ